MIADDLQSLQVIVMAHAIDTPNHIIDPHIVHAPAALYDFIGRPNHEVGPRIDEEIEVLHMRLELLNLRKIGVSIRALRQTRHPVHDDF